MAGPKKFCRDDRPSFYGYQPEDVIRVGGPQGKSIRGPKGEKGDKGDKGDPGIDGIDGEGDNLTFNTNLALLYQLTKL